MSCMETSPIYNSHEIVAENARACPGEWVSAGLYQSESGAVGTAWKIRTGRKAAYEPAGAYQSFVRYSKGIEVLVRYVLDELTVPPMPPLDDRRPLARVAEPRIARSEDPEQFRTAMARAQRAAKHGEDLVAARWTTQDPIRVAAEIEVLAGLRRLSAFRKDSK